MFLLAFTGLLVLLDSVVDSVKTASYLKKKKINTSEAGCLFYKLCIGNLVNYSLSLTDRFFLKEIPKQTRMLA